MRYPIPATLVALVAWALLSAAGLAAPTALADDEPPYGVGYWKTHPTWWPIEALTVGNRIYTESELLVILNTPNSGDVTYQVAAQLIAAELNFIVGVETPAHAAVAMDEADSFLIAHQLGSAPTDPAVLLKAERLVKSLTAFNEGKPVPLP